MSSLFKQIIVFLTCRNVVALRRGIADKLIEENRYAFFLQEILT